MVKMEHDWQVLQNVTQGLRLFMKTYNTFRNDNFFVNDLFENIEHIINLDKFNKKRCALKKNWQASQQQPTTTSAVANQSLSAVKKRKFCTDSNETNAATESINKDELNNTTAKTRFGDGEAASDVSSEEQVFSTNTFDHILDKLPSSDLKTCRLVNSTWNTTTTKFLLQQQTFKICFDFDLKNPSEEDSDLDSDNSDFMRQKKKSPEKDLKKLTTIVTNTLTNNREFPCNKFAFLSCNLTNSRIQNFLKNCGRVVQYLDIDICNVEDEGSDVNDEFTDYYEHDPNRFKLLRDFKKSLTEYLPNLEGLIVGKFPRFWLDIDDLGQLFPEPRARTKTSGDKDKTLELKLKSLSFLTRPPQKILDDLLTSAPSLTELGLGPKCQFLLNSLIETSKIHLLTFLEVKLEPRYLDVYRNFISSEIRIPNLHLKTLVIRLRHITSSDHGYWMEMSQVVSKFLRCSSDSLEILHTQPLGDCVGFGLEVPLLPKLKKLKFTEFDVKLQTDVKLFPDGFRFWNKFPALESFETLVVDLDWESIFHGCHVDVHQFESLKHLYFKCGPPSKWVEKFCVIFPNLISVRIGIENDFVQACKALWKLEKLQCLRIAVDFNMDNDHNAYPAMDIAFTGFSKETCLQLYENSRDVDISSLEGLRENASILDAKKLRKLELSIVDTGVSYRGEEQGARRPITVLPIMSHVTGLFAFKMCPKLHVALAFSFRHGFMAHSFKRGLSPILPFVDQVLEGKNPFESK